VNNFNTVGIRLFKTHSYSPGVFGMVAMQLLRCSVWLLCVVSCFRRFEAAVLQGKSPTMEMLFDWGTTNCTVGDLVEILVRHQLFAAVSVLLPDDQICHTKAGILTCSENLRIRLH